MPKYGFLLIATEEASHQYALGRGKGATMPENTASAGSTSTQAEPTQSQPAGGSERTFTQEDLNRLIGEARIKERSKFEGFEELKAKADQYDALAERDKTETQKAIERAEKAEREASALKAAKARAEAISEAAKASGVDADLLSRMVGDTVEEIAANAAVLKSKIAQMPVYPDVPDVGASGAPTITKDEIESIKNPMERVKARAQHPDLYR